MSRLLAAYDRSNAPLYMQVAAVMRQRVISGQWPAGEQIPIIDELTQEFQVARVTVRQAIALLDQEGLLSSKQGRGTFVLNSSTDRQWLQLETTWERLINSVKENVPHQLVIEKNTAPPRLDLDDGDPAQQYVQIRSVQFRGNESYSVVKVFLDREIYDLNPQSFSKSAALAAIASQKGIRVHSAHQTLIVGSADPNIADLMQIPLGAPTVECRCVVIDDRNVAIYVADIIYRSDCIKLRIDLFSHEVDSLSGKAALRSNRRKVSPAK